MELAVVIMHGMASPIVGLLPRDRDLGGGAGDDGDTIDMFYAASIATNDNDLHHLVSIPLAGTLVGPTFGEESHVRIPKSNVSMWCVIEVDAKEKKSPHPVVNMFRKFWDLYPDEAESLEGEGSSELAT